MAACKNADERGTVYVEFLLVAPPLLLLCLCALQYALLAASELGVQHAAVRAARSAAVILPDDPRHYDGQAVNELPANGRCSGSALTTLAAVVGIDSGLRRARPCKGGERWSKVRWSAAASLLPFAPSIESFLPHDTGRPGQSSTLRWLWGASAYLDAAMGVSLMRLDEATRRDLPLRLEEGELLRLEVSYLSPCIVPVARELMCDSGVALSVGKRARRLEASTGSAGLLKALLMSPSGRFALQAAEAYMPLQSAPRGDAP